MNVFSVMIDLIHGIKSMWRKKKAPRCRSAEDTRVARHREVNHIDAARFFIPAASLVQSAVATDVFLEIFMRERRMRAVGKQLHQRLVDSLRQRGITLRHHRCVALYP